MFKKRIIPGFLAGALALSCSISNVLAYDSVSPTVKKWFRQDGMNFYDIEDGKVTGRLDLDDTFGLMKKTILSQDTAAAPTLLQCWASIANGIIASNPSSYFSYGDEDGFGEGKSFDLYKMRFTHDVQNGKGYYGNLYKLLSNPESTYQTTNDGANSSRWRQDINTYSSGLQSAQNLAQVQEAAFRALADLNGSRNAKAEDFKEKNEIKAMSDTAPKDGKQGSGTPALYTFVATRDRQGATFAYDYNLIGLAFYDFTLQPLTGDNGTAVKTALDGLTMAQAAEQVQKGGTIKGFKYTDNPTAAKSVDEKYNYSDAAITVEKTLGTSGSTKASYSESTGHDFKISNEVKTNFQYNWGVDMANRCVIDIGYAFGHEDLTKMAKSEDHSVSKDFNESSKQTIVIPAHTMLAIESSSSEKSVTEEYSRPVAISYKTAVFSMNGRYYDDNAAVLSFSTVGYQQRSFFAEIGSSKYSQAAWSNLKARAVDHVGDCGFDKATGITRQIGLKHGSGYYKYDWDHPRTDSLDWNDIQSKMEQLRPADDLTNDYVLDFAAAKKYLVDLLPFSLSGGSLLCDSRTTKVAIKEFLPIKTLARVTLGNSGQENMTLTPGETVKLSSLNLAGTDPDGVSFHGFDPAKGQWKLTDEQGNVLNASDLGNIAVNANGDTVFTAGRSRLGTVYVKYFVNENAYKLADQSMVNPRTVKTPMIAIKIDSPESRFGGTIEVPEQIELEFEQGVPIDLTSVNGLNAYVFDENENQLEVQPAWYRREYDCFILNNQMYIGKQGTFH
ncbi:MAG: hypothetical protein HUJ54_12710, partial [Erysipelotrichaceae bacterium]|nr:hypothetical protein [Erysipelotrichaceae bacterium]